MYFAEGESNIRSMRLGVPKKERHFVFKDSSAEENLRENKRVLWTESVGGNYAITTCEETPSKEVCIECLLGNDCNFSKDLERK